MLEAEFPGWCDSGATASAETGAQQEVFRSPEVDLRGDSRILVASLFCLLAWEVSSVLPHTLLSGCAVLARELKENMGL